MSSTKEVDVHMFCNESIITDKKSQQCERFVALAKFYVENLITVSCVRTEQNIIKRLFEHFTQPLNLLVRLGSSTVTLDLKFLTTKFNYFKAMFECNMEESHTREVKLHDIWLIDFLHILVHANGDPIAECDFCSVHNNAMLSRLIEISVYLQNDCVYTKSMQYILDSISPTNCVDLMVCGYSYTNEEVFSKALRYALYYGHYTENEEKVKKYLKSEYSDLMHYYLRHPMRNDPTEWIPSSSDSQGKKVPYKLLNLQMTYVETERSYHVQLVEGDSLPDSTPTVVFDHSLPDTNPSATQEFKGYHVSRYQEMLYISGGEFGLGRGIWNPYVYELNTMSREVKIVGFMPEKRRHHRSGCSGHHLYIAGGVNKYRCNMDTVYQISLAPGHECAELPSLPFMFPDALIVDEENMRLIVKHDPDYYELDLLECTRWEEIEVADEEEVAAIVNSGQKQTVWYPDFTIPKLKHKGCDKLEPSSGEDEGEK